MHCYSNQQSIVRPPDLEYVLLFCYFQRSSTTACFYIEFILKKAIWSINTGLFGNSETDAICLIAHFEKTGVWRCSVERKLLNIMRSHVLWSRGSFQNNHAEWVLCHKTPRCDPYQSNWIKSRQRLIYSAPDSSLCLTRLVSTLCSCTLPWTEMKSCHCS